MKPQRIQLRRHKGFRLQEVSHALNGLPAVKCDRSTRYGNPHTIDNSGAVDPILRFAAETAPLLDLGPLRGKNLACWCKPGDPCHADVLLDLANAADAEPVAAIDDPSDEPSAGQVLRDYGKTIAAAQAATEAAAELLRCVREEDAVSIDEMIEKFLDAARLIAEIEERPEMKKILQAIFDWQTGDR